MALQFRRGTETDRLSIVPAAGEPIWTTDTKQLYVGDGSTTGGNVIGGNQVVSTNSNVTFNSIAVTTTATVTGLRFGPTGTVITSTNQLIGPTGPVGAGGTVAYFGAFYDITTQTNASSTSSNVIAIGQTFNANGISIVGGNKVTFSTSGTYLTNLLGQFITTGGGSNYLVTVWIAQNGTAIPNSAYTFTTGGVGQQVLANIETNIVANAGDYVQFYWSSQNTYMQLLTTAAGSSPTRPFSPSVNLTIGQITYSNLGPTGPTGAAGTSFNLSTVTNQALFTTSSVTFAQVTANTGTFNLGLNVNNQVITNSAGLTGVGYIPIAITNSATQINVYNGYTSFNTPVRVNGNVTATSITFADNSVQSTAWTGNFTTSTLYAGSFTASLSSAYGDFRATKFLSLESPGATSGGGYSFSDDTSQDTGMFSPADGRLQFVSNGVTATEITAYGAAFNIYSPIVTTTATITNANGTTAFFTNHTGTNVRIDGAYTATAVVTNNPGIFIATNNSGANPTTTNTNVLGLIGFGGYDGTVYTTADKYPTVQFQATAAENWARNANNTTTNAGSSWNISSVIRNTLYGAYNSASLMKIIDFTAGQTSGANQGAGVLVIGTGNATTATFYNNAGNQFQSYPKTNVNFINTQLSLYGVSTSDTTDRDNNTLSGGDSFFITTSRRSGVSGRRNAVTATDQLFLLNIAGMNAYNSSGFGATTALFKVNTVENFGATTAGSRITIQTANTGTTTMSNRLLLDDRVNAYGSDSHKFTDKSGGFTALNMTTGTATFTAIPVMPTYTIAGKPASGAVGQMICISNSTPGGRMAYWDTTNARWSYVADDSAV